MEPPDAPPFFVGKGHLPESLREEIYEHGFAAETWDRIIQSGVETLIWRGNLKHLDGEFGATIVSAVVFDALRDISPGSFFSRGEFTIHGGQAKTHHLLGVHHFPASDNDPAEIDSRPVIIGSESSPAFDGGYRESIEAHKGHRGDAVLAFPSWIARDDKVIKIGFAPAVTEGFVEKWQNTEISKHLRDNNNFEHDIVFLPNSGVRSNYRWVDVGD